MKYGAGRSRPIGQALSTEGAARVGFHVHHNQGVFGTPHSPLAGPACPTGWEPVYPAEMAV
jgi:hypothetical protein